MKCEMHVGETYTFTIEMILSGGQSVSFSGQKLSMEMMALTKYYDACQLAVSKG